jgi:hypothetical protein
VQQVASASSDRLADRGIETQLPNDSAVDARRNNYPQDTTKETIEAGISTAPAAELNTYNAHGTNGVGNRDDTAESKGGRSWRFWRRD